MAVDQNKLEEETCIIRFYKIVLSWDYLRLLKESDKWKKIGDGSAAGLKKVKDRYKDIDEYLDYFEPLLFEEVKALIVQGQNEEEVTEWGVAIVEECNEVNGFYLPTIICGGQDTISQNDLLLLSTKKFGEGKELPTAYAFALVEHRQQDKLRLRLYLHGEIKKLNVEDIQPCSRLRNIISLLSEVQKCFYFLKICSLSTILREYVALQSISSIPFKDLILTAVDADNKTEDRSWKISRPLMEFIEANHNKSQLEAINAGLSRKTFILIQGPPGTGKTQTILGLLSAILHATPARLQGNRGNSVGLKRGLKMPVEEKYGRN